VPSASGLNAIAAHLAQHGRRNAAKAALLLSASDSCSTAPGARFWPVRGTFLYIPSGRMPSTLNGDRDGTMSAINRDTHPGTPGLSSTEAARRLQRSGPNLLPQPERRSWLRIVWSVLREPMLLLLMGASGIYLLLGDPQEAAVLAASVVLVIALTVYQEHKSERALQALRDLSSPRAHVFRDGKYDR
jgi:hypothetical protein